MAVYTRAHEVYLCLAGHSYNGNSCWPGPACVSFPLAHSIHQAICSSELSKWSHFFHGWLISIGHYVENLIKHDCFKGGEPSEILAKFPGRLSLTSLFVKLPTFCRYFTNPKAACREGKSTWIAVKCQRSVEQRLSLSTFLLFFNSTLPPLSLPSIFSFFQEHFFFFCQWYGDEVFYKVTGLSRYKITLAFNYLTVGSSVSHLLNYAFRKEETILSIGSSFPVIASSTW